MAEWSSPSKDVYSTPIWRISSVCRAENERSLHHKGKLEEYEAQVRDYGERDHSQTVPIEDLVKPVDEHLYLPVHGIEKATSTTTKLRVVSDASAKT